MSGYYTDGGRDSDGPRRDTYHHSSSGSATSDGCVVVLIATAGVLAALGFVVDAMVRAVA